MSVEEVLASVVHELNPDTVFFLSESYPVSDEKLSGDIVLPNVFFSHHSEMEVKEPEGNHSGTMQKRSNSSANQEPE